MRAITVTGFLHSRAMVILTAAIVACGTAYVASEGIGARPDMPLGLVDGWNTFAVDNAAVSAVLAVAITLGVALLTIHLNKAYSLMRNLTKLQATTFMLMQLATPALLVWAVPGQMLLPVVVLCVALMFRAYAEPRAMRGVYLVFVMLSADGAWDWLMLWYIPIFWLVCAQMRILSARSVLASLMGIATPWIILFGFGIIGPDDIVNPFTESDFGFSVRDIPMLSATMVSAFILVAAWLQNVLKILTYNARRRALFSVITVLSLTTVLFVVLTAATPMAMLPMLNFCAAMQLAHLFAETYNQRRTWVAILPILLLYILLFVWATIS